MAAKLLDISASGRQRIDRYELIGEIASGGMATVFLARLTGLGGFQRFVALKRLHPHLATEKDFVRMFLDEARLAAGIHHPNVVPILEVGAGRVGYYLVMEYVEGETLARLLARAASTGVKLPIEIAIRIGLDTLAGLHAAHELKDESGAPTNLVHRDVSPQNVLVGADGIARITDFGVARAASRLGDTRVGQLKGKIAYMAPEQASGVEELDRRADVFAAGIVIWEALAQRRLFKAQNEAATLSRVMNEPVPSLSAYSKEVPRDVGLAVMRALERNPARRYSTCAEFGDALESAAQANGLVGSSRDLAGYVADVIGDEIAQQREAVRAWLAQSEASSSGPLLTVGNASTTQASVMALPEFGSGVATAPYGAAQPGRRSKARWAAVLLLLSVAAAGVVLYLKNQQAKPQGVDSTAPALQPPPAVPPTTPTPSPPSSPTASEPEEEEPKAFTVEEAVAESSDESEEAKSAAPAKVQRSSRSSAKPEKKKKKKKSKGPPKNPYQF